MKKTFLATALILGMSSTAFAAANNPFSDVPQGHWAYNSVAKLAAEGIIEGYGDGTYRGNRNITRYEMAQMVARALARYDQLAAQVADASRAVANTRRASTPAVTAPAPQTQPARPVISGASRAELDSLAYEFREELDGLGVRVEELEKHSDMVKWNGKIEYSYEHLKFGNEKAWAHGAKFQFDPSAEVNDHWTANARFEAEVDFRDDSTTSSKLERIWAEGNYDNFNVRLGRMELFTNEEGLIWDTEFSGAQLTFGDRFKAVLMAGRLAGDGIEIGAAEDHSDILGANLQYDAGKGLAVGGGYYYLEDDDFRTTDYSNSGDTNKASVWSANLGYTFSDNFSIHGAYAQNTKADTEKSAWQAQLKYGVYDDNPERGDWGVWAGYRRYGSNVSFVPTEDDTIRGTKGWFVGGGYAPFKNIGVTLRYFDGKTLSEDKTKTKHFLGKVEFFF